MLRGVSDGEVILTEELCNLIFASGLGRVFLPPVFLGFFEVGCNHQNGRQNKVVVKHLTKIGS